MSSTFQSPLAGPPGPMPTFFLVGLGGQQSAVPKKMKKIFNSVLEWGALALVFFKPVASAFGKRSRLGERQSGVPDFCGALREYLREHDENVEMKIAAQRFEKSVSKKMSFLFRSFCYVARVDSLLDAIVILRFCLFRSVLVWSRQGQKDSACWCTCW